MFRGGAVLATSLCLAAPLAAQEYPALFSVTGVSADDSLNVRAEPGASAPVVGTLSYDQINVEVTAANEAGTWGRINLGEGSGWVSLSFLTMQEGSAMPDAEEVTCFGTEPFWSYHVVSEQSARWSGIDDVVVTMQAGPFERAAARFEPFISVAGGPGQQGLLVMHKDPQCSDGMSDALYGLSATVVLTGGLSRAVSGCCSLALD